MGAIRPWRAWVRGGALAVGVAAGPAHAASVDCRFENGAILVPAAFERAAGEWLVDVAAPHTILHETRAQMEGIAELSAVGRLRLAGERLDGVTVVVESLDARSPGFVPPIVGAIGADVLGRYVVDLDFAPCRLTLHEPGTEPRMRGVVLPLRLVDGRPTVRAAIADGRTALAGDFLVDTASRAALRLPVLQAGDRGDGRQVAPSFIRALSLAGVLFEKAPAARGAEIPPGVAGAIGTAALSRWRLRLDIPGGRLVLEP